MYGKNWNVYYLEIILKDIVEVLFYFIYVTKKAISNNRKDVKRKRILFKVSTGKRTNN